MNKPKSQIGRSFFGPTLAMLVVVIGLSFAYVSVPADLTLIRHLVSGVQLLFMVITMIFAIIAVFRDF